MICKQIVCRFFLFFFLKLELIGWDQLYIAIVCIQLNDFKFCCVIRMIQFNTSHLFAHS